MLRDSGEATSTNFIVFGLIQPGIELRIYRTWCEHTNHYTTDTVVIFWSCSVYIFTKFSVTAKF